MEKGYYLNTSTQLELRKEKIPMDIGAYFEILKYVLMAATFVVLVLVFLHLFYGKEEKQD
jgi:hypothetical protein